MEHIWFSGNYSTWNEARAASTGYDAPAILDKVRRATLAVIRGEAACERDSVALPTIEYSMPLLAALLYIASRCGNRLSVLDFGGSLGSSYWQNRKFLAHLDHLRWNVVEQPHFVKTGREEIANNILRFYPSIEACLESESPHLVLLSSVLPYVERPFDLLKRLIDVQPEFIVIDRTPFFVDNLADRLTVETVPPAIYEGSYPAWFFNLAAFRSVITGAGYSIFEELNSWEAWTVDGDAAQSKCFILERKRQPGGLIR